MRMTPKAARRMGLMPPDTPKPTTTTTTRRTPVRRRASYTSLGLLGWVFGGNEQTIFAFRCRRDGRIDRTARLPPGDGDDLGKHYRPAILAIERGEYTTEEAT